jgi:hypothetical protein
MSRPTARFSIAGVLGVIALFAVGFAALASPSAFWLNTLFSLNLAILIAALIGWLFHRDPARRAFWAGFLVAGGIYLVLSRSWWLGEQRLGEQLATTMLLDILYAQIEPLPQTVPPAVVGYGGMMGMGGGGMMSGVEGGMAGMMGGMSAGMMGGMPAGTPPASTPPTRWSQWTAPDRIRQYYPVGTVTTLGSPFGFLRIGHSLFSLIFGIMGGLLAQKYRRGVENPSGVPQSS